MGTPRRVVLLVESSRAYGRSCLLGIASYIQAHGTWQVLHIERALSEKVLAVVGAWNADGILARIADQQTMGAVSALQLPTVDLLGYYQSIAGAVLDTDSAACADLAVKHFLNRGFRHFAFCGYAGLTFSDQRVEQFVNTLATLEKSVHVYESPGQLQVGKAVTTTAREIFAETEADHVAAWLASLPKPIAIFACNDIRGRQVLSACAQAQLSVPDEVAVLGVDDDEVICELSQPPLSSIGPDAFRIGFRGAEVLEQLMDGATLQNGTLLIPPRIVITRQSTSTIAVEDPAIAAAIHFIRDHACEGIRVEDVVARAQVSRATLERRFRQLLNRSPAEEICQTRMKKVELLLAETHYKLSQVAQMTGFTSAAQLVTTFKRHRGQTPGEFRKSKG